MDIVLRNNDNEIVLKKTEATISVDLVKRNQNLHLTQVGKRGIKGDKGDKGDTGEGVPIGGSTGQVLAKASNGDYDTEWVNQGSGTGQVESVNGQTGTVVLDADDISDTSTTHKFATSTQLTDIGLNTAARHTHSNKPVLDATTASFTTADKSKLDGIESGAEVNNISDVNATDLTDGGASTLHYHASDRARANHTGTQTASTISDFQTAVSSNTDVVANTAARHAPVSVTDSGELDFTLTGQNITASIKTASIDESKLDASTNASLDLADSSVQQSSGSVTDNGVARYDGTTGRVIQASGSTLDDNGTITSNALHLSTNTVGTHTSAGNISYNSADRTLDVAVGNGAIANLPEELWVTFQNDTGSTIPDGTVIQFVGTIGASGNMRGKPAVLSEITNPRQILGIATESVANGARGKATRYGAVRGLNTSGMTEGSAIYLSTTTGQLTTTEPTEPNLSLSLGVVTTEHATVGTIQVNTFTIPPKLENLSDVNGTPLTTSGQILVWDNANKNHDFTANINDYATTASVAAGYQPLDADLTIWASKAAPSGTVVGTTDTQVLTGKTFTDSTTFFQDDLDNTKKAQFQLSSISSATTRTITLPNSNGTMYVSGGSDVSVADGGTGRSTSTTAYGVIAAGTTATGAHQTIAPGTSGQFLKSNGAAALGSFANIAQSDVTNLVTDLAGKEPAITAGTTSQYYRGDKTFQTLDKTSVGLSNVDNVSVTANGMGVVVHGSTASTARPTGFSVITWIGSVSPTNAATNDIYIYKA